MELSIEHVGKETALPRLTPHTLRLIRLITSSSSSPDNDHTQHAIAILSSIASKSHPLLLWDILARLYASLTNVDENHSSDRGGGDNCLLRRECIAIAMEHVAKFVPIADRRHFMNDDSTRNWSTGNGLKDEKMWLTVQDLLPTQTTKEEEWDALDQVLLNGRLLLSSSGAQYDIISGKAQGSNYEEEEAMLSSLDTSTLTSTSIEEQEKLLTKRIALQRKILASRLGFCGYLSANISTKDLIADEDLVLSDKTTAIEETYPKKKPSARERNLKRIEKRRRDETVVSSNMIKTCKKMKQKATDDTRKNENKNRINKDEDDEEDGEKLTIRNILLLSLNQRPQSTLQQKSCQGSTPLSHQSTQNILATDMIYNSVHPSWHVRHGSLLGLLALLKSWKSTSDIVDVNEHELDQQSAEHFGKWPQDILTRCLCILALDRFGDFSGSSVIIKQNKEMNPIINENKEIEISAAMTAPVREVAARVLSFLLEIAPKSLVQRPSYRILVKLAERDLEWEVRHGAMLGFKFIAQVIGTQNHEIAPYHTHLDTVWNSISSHACKGLQDQSDDVKGAAAQALSCLITELESDTTFKSDQLQSKEIITASVEQTWSALREVETTSSCTLDLLNLFSSMISINSCLVLSSMGILRSKNSNSANELLQKMNDFLYFDDYSVRLRCFQSLSIVAEPIASVFVHDEIKRGGDQTIRLYCELILNMFDVYMDCTNLNEDKIQDDGEPFNSYGINDSRDRAWISMVEATILLMRDEDFPLIRETLVMLLFRLIKVDFSKTFQGEVDMRQFTQEADIRSKKSGYYRNLHFAIDAFIGFYKQIGREMALDTLIITFVLGLIESPFFEFCEVGCILLKFVARTKDDKGCLLMSTFAPHLLSMLDKGAKCMIVDCDESMSRIRNDERFIQHSTKLLIYTNSDTLQNQSFHVLSQDTANFIVKKVSNMWLEVFKTFDIELDQLTFDFKRKSRKHMRLMSSIVGTIISLGQHHLPSKVTSIVRTLMTSMKNEDTICRSRKSCEDLVNLIQLLRKSSKQQVVDKIVGNVCKLAAYDPQIDQLPPDYTECGTKASREILKMIVRAIPQSGDLTDEVGLWCKLECLKNNNPATTSSSVLSEAILIFCEVSTSLIKDTKVYDQVTSDLLPTSIVLACTCTDSFARQKAATTTTNIAVVDPLKSVPVILPFLFEGLNAREDDAQRLGACSVLGDLVEKLGVALLPFVHCLLPNAMSMMTDPIDRCSKSAASTFAKLVRLAPLVNIDTQNTNELFDDQKDESFRQVVDHLIHGKPLPPITLPPELSKSLMDCDIKLRSYQKEGISWMLFLRALNLNGALTDEMGLGKTLQTLCAIATSHLQEPLSKIQKGKKTRSLIVCPSSVVGHWMGEIRRIDKKSKIFQPLRYSGTSRSRLWNEHFEIANIIVTSYSILRSDVETLTSTSWMYCVLDEGHLIKNPKTLTAKAAQRVRSKHKILLSGSPVQNKVQELWAIFNWLMPNYLGSTTDFAEQYGRDITKGQLPGASVDNIRKAMKKLKNLHQQVLPFILRREKSEVLNQLPPKIITDIPCIMSEAQSCLYHNLSKKEATRNAIESLQNFIDTRSVPNKDSTESGKKTELGRDTLKSLMYLRMICTHPLLLHKPSIEETGDEFNRSQHFIYKYNASGKISALKDLLATAGINNNEITAADNDQSLIYVQKLDEPKDNDTEKDGISFEHNEGMLESLNDDEEQKYRDYDSKCLIFAQFNQSLDILEELLFKPLMPSLRYVRLDGRVDANKRDVIVNQFVTDESVKVMLLTTKVGSLGLNLQVADTVIFLEPDYNPHVDLQAMDRVHRIGQNRTVKVYRLITANSIEEKIMSLQAAKLAISDAIVNTDNSTMFSMGTDKLLDLFDTS